MSLRVLIADESASMRKILIRALGVVTSVEATEVVGGDEALKVFRPGDFDLVVIGQEPAGKNALAAVRDIRKRDAAAPIVMIASAASRSHVEEAIRAGATDYLVKPFTADTLREKLAKYGW